VRRLGVSVWLMALLVGAVVGGLPASAAAGVWESSSRVRAADGKWYSVTNHVVREARDPAGGPRREWLLAWTGDESSNEPFPSSAEPDFLAVIDATRGSRTFGRVVNTVTMDSVFGNEPHHMQYQWSKGDRVYAGGILSDVTYVFDVSRLPEVRLSGVTPSSATPCGTLPTGFEVLDDGSAYATYMGGPDVVGPCTYTNGETRVGNGPGGTPGEIVRINEKGKVLSEVPAGLPGSEGGTYIPPSPLFPDFPATNSCVTIPALPTPSCANPYGIAVREDLDRMVVGDFAEARNTHLGSPPPAFSVRDTVRILDISRRNNARPVSVTHLPAGVREELDPRLSEPFGAMETAVTHRPGHKGAFVGTTNGAIYYTPDMTAAQPRWREVFDDFTGFTRLWPTDTPSSRTDAGGWVRVSPDDRYLYRLVMGGGPFSPGDVENGMMLVLDLRKLLAAGNRARCEIDTMAEVAAGGAEADCPELVAAVPIRDTTSGGPNNGAMDTFQPGRRGLLHDTGQIERVAVGNYYFADTFHDGDHRICMFDVSRGGQAALDGTFRDEVTGEVCLDFDRARWPHGAYGNARPNGLLFVVADRDIY
jgi:hypothetical protein